MVDHPDSSSDASRPVPPILAIASDVGLGKTTAWREHVAAPLAGGGYPCVLLVPRHRLGDQVVRDLAEVGISARVYRGRDAEDPEAPGCKMCRDIERVNLITDALGDVSSCACKNGDNICEFYDECGYQRQRRQRPQLWVGPHQLVFRVRPSFIPQPHVLTIDESFWNAAINGVDKPRKLWLAELAELREIVVTTHSVSYRDTAKTADLIAISTRVYTALVLEPDGRIRREALISAGITVEDLREAYRLEWRRKRELTVFPGQPIYQVREAAAQVIDHNRRVANLARFWELLGRTTISDCEYSPWLWLRRETPLPGRQNRTAPAIYLAWREEVHESWTTAPTILMDATMRAEIVNQFFLAVEVPPRISAPMPNARVRQITDRAMTADMLIPEGDPDEHPNPTRRANVERLRRFLFVRAAELAPGRVLVVCQQGLELALLAGPLPDRVEVAHFNAITGLNAWNNVALVVVIGRTEPAVREVEQIARVLFGAEVAEVQPDDLGNIRYPRVWRGIRMRDGRAVAVEGSCHPDPRVEAVRWAICEAEVVQAIGRGRGVNRTKANPLQIDILTNVCLPIVVDETTTWERIQPTSIDVMIAHGAVPSSYADMATAYPDLYSSAEAARKGISRENPGQTSIRNFLYRRMSGVSSVSYRRIGTRGPLGTLLFDPGKIDPMSWLNERLGPVIISGER